MFETTQVTKVMPAGKTLPEGGLHCTAGTGVPTAIGAKAIVAVVRPGSGQRVMSDGQVMTGGGTSLMMTWKLQLVVLFATSAAVQVTVLVPVAKVEPLG